MRKILSILLCVAMALSALTLVSCNKPANDPAPLKLGLGVYSVATKATNADGETNGKAEAVITVAAVLVDADGKIVKCVIDAAQNEVNYTSAGLAVAKDSFKTKGEQGSNYGMVAYGGATKEWFEQADAFCAQVVGKTVAEVKAMVATNGKGNDAIINAGCTIEITEFVKAVEAAIANAAPSNATAESTLKLGVYTVLDGSDATAEKNGTSKLETTIFAAAVDADKKIVAATSDCVEVKFTFDQTGASTYDTTKAIVSKRAQGDSYGMKAYGNATKEWYEQADAFCAACIGKTAGDINALMNAENKGVESLQTAGCTITINGFVGAASKIG